MFQFFGPNAKRTRLHKSAPDGALKDFLSHPHPEDDMVLENLKLLAVDFETTGLNPGKDSIISIGFVQINNLQIDLSSATHILIKTNEFLPEDTVVIHKITDDQIHHGVALKQAMNQFLTEITGKILVAHHAKIETEFLNQACKALYDGEIIIPVIDTLALEARNLPESEHHHNNLNLTMCCNRYNLPRYKLHDALSDALSCAELLLAQFSYKKINPSSKIAHLIKYLP